MGELHIQTEGVNVRYQTADSTLNPLRDVVTRWMISGGFWLAVGDGRRTVHWINPNALVTFEVDSLNDASEDAQTTMTIYGLYERRLLDLGDLPTD